MNDEQWILLALLGTGAAASGLAATRVRVERPTEWRDITWPRDVGEDGVVTFFRQLAGDRRRHVVALEIVARSGHLTYRLGLAERHAESIVSALTSHVPGAATSIIDHDVARAPEHSWRVTLKGQPRALRTDGLAESARALTAALASASSTVIFQWLLGPRLTPVNAPATGTPRPASSWRDVVKQTVSGAKPLDADERRAIREKVEEAGFQAVCRIGVDAPSPKMAQSVALRVLAALRTTETPGVRIGLRKENPDKIAGALHPRSWPIAVNVRELSGLCGWPMGKASYPGLDRTGARLLRAAESVSRRGRLVAVSTFPGPDRPLALGVRDSLQHLHVLGPTGTGKSTLLLNLIVQDIEAGRGVVVVDPKGDLVDDVLRRVPERRIEDIVVLDPADDQRPVGINVLQGGGRPPELIADQVLAVFHDLYRENWGPRIHDVLHASLLTLADRPGMTLCALPVLLSNRRFRQRCVAALTDDVALKPFWAAFDALSDSARQQVIAPVLTRLRAFLLRPRMRAVIGQAEPAFDIHTVFTQRKVLLVSLAKGLIGPEAAALLGSLLVSQLWQTALGRVRVAADARSPVMVYIDEFQDYLHLPTDVADVLAQARGLGVGLTLAHQHLAQLPTSLRSAVLANARSRVCFQLSNEDARLIAAGAPEIDAVDLQSLGRYEAYVSLVSRSNVTPFASARTLEPTPATSNAQSIRDASRVRFGRDLALIESDLAALVSGEGESDDRPIGKRRRS
jgi:Type IV secretion-system coupling protein DNA-binding domain